MPRFVVFRNQLQLGSEHLSHVLRILQVLDQSRTFLPRRSGYHVNVVIVVNMTCTAVDTEIAPTAIGNRRDRLSDFAILNDLCCLVAETHLRLLLHSHIRFGNLLTIGCFLLGVGLLDPYLDGPQL
jgi:hypothetical protein